MLLLIQEGSDEYRFEMSRPGGMRPARSIKAVLQRFRMKCPEYGLYNAE
jgi:hypothetical protein